MPLSKKSVRRPSPSRKRRGWKARLALKLRRSKRWQRFRAQGKKARGGYHRLFRMVATYAVPQWKLFLLLVVLNFAIVGAATLLTIMTAASLNAFIMPQSLLHQPPGAGGFNLNQIGNWAYKFAAFGHFQNRFELIAALAGTAVAIGVFKSFLTYAASAVGSWNAVSMAHGLQRDLLRHVLTFSMGFFNRHRTGELMSRINSDTATAMQDFASIANSLLVNPLLLAIYIVLVAKTSWTLLGGIVVAGLAHHLISHLLTTPIRKNTHHVIDAGARISGVLQEALTNIRVVKVFAAERVELHRFQERLAQFHKMLFRGALIQGAENPSRLIVNQIVEFVIVVVAAYEYGQNRIPLQTCIFFIFICRSIVSPINLISSAYVQSGRMLATLSRVFELMQTPPELVDGTASVTAFHQTLRVEGAVFSYRDKPVLHGIDLEIRKGEMLALVGPSGGGKSTLTDLLLRLYDPEAGRIVLDGVDVRQMKVQEYRQLFGVVSQESLLFNATIRENILYGRPHLGDEAMLRAARIAHAQGFIEAMPEGYATFVGDRGTRLSGGQRQRIAIARALAGSPEILLLDEATSALDSESEREVQQAITEISKLATSIVIAHRLSTILHADRIAFIENGRILQVGPHAELLETCPRYRRLCDLQYQPADR